MATNDALLVFGELLTRFGAFSTPFDSNSNTMAFKVGEQNVAHYLMAKINSARPDALPKMMPENQRRLTMADEANTEKGAAGAGAAAGSAASGASGAGAAGAGAGAGAGNAPAPVAVTEEGAKTFVTALKGDQRTAFLKAINAAEPVVAPVVPEKYTLKVPEKSLLDATVTERTTAIARTLGLSNDDAAQKVLDFTHQEVASAVEATMKAYQPGGAEWTAQVDQWKKAALADPELGNGKQETLDAAATKAKAVLDRFFPSRSSNSSIALDTVRTRTS
jgi:hypothetical protein